MPLSEAIELIGSSTAAGPFLFTCEHASNHVPPPLQPSARDRELLAQHWGWDIGARDLAHALVGQLGGQAGASTFSRLVIDPNRPPAADSLVLREIDGQPVDFNAGVDAAQIDHRRQLYFDGYHGGLEQIGSIRSRDSRGFHVVSIHSFTPVYLGHARPMEIGVLFDNYDREAFDLESALSAEGFASALNEPYSGRGPGALIYSAHRHGRGLGVKYLELEVRQDLIDTPERARGVGERIARALQAAFLPDGW